MCENADIFLPVHMMWCFGFPGQTAHYCVSDYKILGECTSYMHSMLVNSLTKYIFKRSRDLCIMINFVATRIYMYLLNKTFFYYSLAHTICPTLCMCID